MLPIVRRYIISRKLSCLNSCKIWGPDIKIRNFRPANYSNIPIFRNLSSLQRKHTLSYACGIHFRWLHNETETGLQGSLQKFENLLRNIEGDKNDLSVDQINSYVSEMTSLLDDLAFEEHHGVKIIKNKSITKLFEALHRSIEQMPAKDLTNALDLCYKLYVPLNAEVCCKMISKLKNCFEDLNFVDKVRFYTILPHFVIKFKDRTAVQKLIDDVGQKLCKEIRSKVYLNSPEDTAAALCFSYYNLFVPKEDKENILRTVLGLKNWDHSFIFKYFFKTIAQTHDSLLLKDLYYEFLSRMQKETNHNYLHYFLLNYADAVEKNMVEYDSDLVDSVISKLLTSQMTTIQIRKTIDALLGLKHSHDGLLQYLIGWLKKNPRIYVSHPTLSCHIIGFIAFFNNFSEDGNQLAAFQSDLTENPNLFGMLRHVNPNFGYLPDRYLYILLDLASLEIYIEEELINLSKVLKRRNIQSLPVKLQMFLVNLNQAVQLFHPNFQMELLSNEDALAAIIKIKEKRPSGLLNNKLNFLEDVGSHLKVGSREHNCLLTLQNLTPSFRCDGIVAVNNEGQFYDFEEYRDKKDLVLLEDVSIPEGFELICLMPVFEGQFARNSLRLTSDYRLRIKIQERLGLPTVVLYEPIWNKLCSDEKGNYLRKMILEKLSTKNSAEHSSDIAQSLES